MTAFAAAESTKTDASAVAGIETCAVVVDPFQIVAVFASLVHFFVAFPCLFVLAFLLFSAVLAVPAVSAFLPFSVALSIPYFAALPPLSISAELPSFLLAPAPPAVLFSSLVLASHIIFAALEVFVFLAYVVLLVHVVLVDAKTAYAFVVQSASYPATVFACIVALLAAFVPVQALAAFAAVQKCYSVIAFEISAVEPYHARVHVVQLVNFATWIVLSGLDHDFSGYRLSVDACDEMNRTSAYKMHCSRMGENYVTLAALYDCVQDFAVAQHDV